MKHPQLLDLKLLNQAAQVSGVQWGGATDDLNINVLSWDAGHQIESHINHEVDVLWIMVEGTLEVVVDNETMRLVEGQALTIPKGSERSMRAVSRVTYLSVHRRRNGLTIATKTDNQLF